MTLSILLYLTLGLVAAVVLIVLLRAAHGGQSVFRARPIMTDNEVEFFRRLVAAWPEGYVFPQVAMSALLKPAATTSRAHRAAFNRISQKRVDYAIYTADMQLHCIVELDDRSHNPQRDARRDAWLASAGIVTLRFTQKDRPAPAELKERLLKRQASPAPTAAPRTVAPGRPGTVQATAKPRPATLSTAAKAPPPAAAAAAVAPARPAPRPAPQPNAPAPAPARAPASAAAQAADELELLEFSPATAAPARR
jgi:hypothetical protein